MLTINWARNILKSLDSIKRSGTTAKWDMNPALYEELIFSWKRKIVNIIFEHRIHNNMILNFDETSFGFTLPDQGSQSISIANVDDKRQINGTFPFRFNISSRFLPFQLIHGGVIDRCHPIVKFPESFNITYSQNDWSYEGIVIEYFRKIIFPFLAKKRKGLNLLDDTKVPLIVAVFKATDSVNELLQKRDCVFVQGFNNYTNLFQPLDVSVNKSTKCYIVGRLKDWCTEKVLKQLNHGVQTHDVKVVDEEVFHLWAVVGDFWTVQLRVFVNCSSLRRLFAGGSDEVPVLHKVVLSGF